MTNISSLGSTMSTAKNGSKKGFNETRVLNCKRSPKFERTLTKNQLFGSSKRDKSSKNSDDKNIELTKESKRMTMDPASISKCIESSKLSVVSTRNSQVSKGPKNSYSKPLVKPENPHRSSMPTNSANKNYLK